MIALQLLEIKPFMNKLLIGDVFHNFLLSEATIVNGITFSIDGHVMKQTDASLSEDFPYALTTFQKVQHTIYECVKGTKTPSYMKFIFCLSPDNVEKTLRSINSPLTNFDISGMYINVTYQNQQLLVTSGISYSIFTKNHALEQEWDRLVQLFFNKNEIFYELLS